MSEQRGTHGVEKMAEVLGVARSGYYSWIEGGQSARAVEEKELVEQIQEIQGEVSHRYGSPRMREELQRRGRHVGKKRVARIMRENALGPRPKRRFVLTTRSEKGQEVAENLLDRNFEVPAANRVWVSDITYVATSEGWMYLCTVLDLYSRRVVGWSLSSCVDTELVLAAVAMAVIRRRPPRGLMFHSDRGVQYTSGQFQSDCRRVRFHSKHEPQGRLLGQRVRGNVLQDLESRVDSGQDLPKQGGGQGRDIRIRGGLLQSQAASLVPRLPHTDGI